MAIATTKVSAAALLDKCATVQEVLELISAGAVDVSAATKRIAELSQSAPKALTFRVSDKGAVSVYGLQKQFPVTLYLGQWERLFARIDGDDGLKSFINANRDKLSVKPAKT